MEDLVGGNEVFKARTKGVGIISKELAEEYGVSGPILRASGVKFDLRTQTDFLPYDKFEYEIPVGENGDCYDRWYVRLLEMRESAKIILQAIDSMPSGPLQTKVPKVIKVPKGRSYVRTENPKGEILLKDGVLIFSRYGPRPPSEIT
jgi:NADH-quinone oxidoreductase subunit D